tara:strand:- start:263 stop:613 length:351 start_codon:yes stop_codon:yes gene_type:complete
MSEENTIDTESETPEVSPAENFVNAVTAKDFVSASKDFENMMMAKVDDALDQEKISLAAQIFNGEDPNEEDINDETEEEEDESEEDLEAEAEEDESEEEIESEDSNEEDNDGIAPE